MNEKAIQPNQTPRRQFIKTGGAAVVGGTFAVHLAFTEKAFAANSDTLKIGLIGCGGRGTGAASQALNADSNVVLSAMGDAFGDQLERSHSSLKADEKLRDRVQVEPEHRFVGLEA